MKRGDIKANRLIASEPTQNKRFKDLSEEFIGMDYKKLQTSIMNLIVNNVVHRMN